jgi:rfaE bifunctional protein nucleotidyltransferase chain/domain
VVFTNGCFDLIHAGHLKVLEFSKRHGDLLVVGLNSDASVRRLKGAKRPILPLKDRGALMAALKPVDYVTWFGEDTPHDLIRRLKPEVLVKGGDWSADQIAVLGDFSQYIVYDRLGVNVEFIQNVVDGDGLPVGKRGLVAYKRVGGDVSDVDAFRLLKA